MSRRSKLPAAVTCAMKISTIQQLADKHIGIGQFHLGWILHSISSWHVHNTTSLAPRTQISVGQKQTHS
ncbi:hypothetical protein M747DRAFT_168994 [Aspergillus niger ATCC 13496]|uniref:Uncharacterized protein n=1 Tax=Aspergillus niger ATCC 13496 TaxID=1353008 RepID=A0A370BFH4_ASPNG|nr:hypothetical protein M747DRAFT_168994 [Aspergillus niger ATCC 13496]